MTLSLRHAAAAALLVLAPAALAGCGDDGPSTTPSGSDTPSAPASTPTETGSTTTPDSPAPAVGPTLDITIEGDSVDPVGKKIDARTGDTLLVTVTSDRAGELHVHSSPEQELEFGPGTTELKVKLGQPGQVDVEEHESDTLLARVLVK